MSMNYDDLNAVWDVIQEVELSNHKKVLLSIRLLESLKGDLE